MSNLSATLDDPTYDEAPEPVEVHRNGVLSGVLGVVACVVAIAYLARAAGGGSVLDWVLALAMGAVGAAYLAAFVDARTPLLVADAQGVRIRLGRSWRGVPWDAIECVEHRPRRGLMHDGRLVLVAQDPIEVFGDLDSSGRRQARLAARLHGAPLAIPLGISTRVIGAGEDLTGALTALAGDTERVVETGYADDPDDPDGTVLEDEQPDEYVDEVEEVPEDEHLLLDPRPTLARALDFLADRLRMPRGDRECDREYDEEEVVDDPEASAPEASAPEASAPEASAPEPTVALPTMIASATPLPLRVTSPGARAEIRFDGAAAFAVDPAGPDNRDDSARRLPEADQLRRADRAVIDDLLIERADVEPAADPVVGPELAAARTRLGLTVDGLAERTRIRPHVIESIEVDDFAPCGGDFYARGHLRTLARVLGVDAAPLLETYDERYADAPINARRVFEAELATGVDGPIRSTRGGPNWSVLVAAVMALVLAWSIARLIMDSPVELHSKPVLNGSPSAQTRPGPAVPVVLDAADGGTHVVVRDSAGRVVFNGDLPYGGTKAIKASPPVWVQSSDGALKVSVDGQDRGPLGSAGRPAQDTFAADDS